VPAPAKTADSAAIFQVGIAAPSHLIHLLTHEQKESILPQLSRRTCAESAALPRVGYNVPKSKLGLSRWSNVVGYDRRSLRRQQSNAARPTKPSSERSSRLGLSRRDRTAIAAAYARDSGGRSTVFALARGRMNLLPLRHVSKVVIEGPLLSSRWPRQAAMRIPATPRVDRVLKARIAAVINSGSTIWR
jgi:hypothetical protein